MRSADEIWDEAAREFSGYGLVAVRRRAIEQAQREAIEEAAKVCEGLDRLFRPVAETNTAASYSADAGLDMAEAIRALLPHREGQ